MIRVILLLCFISRVLTMRSHHQVYVSRKSRSNSVPTNAGYVYSQFNNDPASFSTFGYSARDDSSGESLERYNPLELKHSVQYSAPIAAMKSVGDHVYTTPSTSQYGVDYEIAKSEAKYNSKFMPSKLKTDAMYERLKSIMHYHPPVDSGYMTTYGHNEYNVDDDDVRSNSRSSYDNWPYYYHSPYEYEHMKIDSEIEKAKDKRYAADSARVSIPVHEDLDGDPHNTFGPLTTERYNPARDNPIIGDQPFFSFVLNDYFDRSKEDDTFIFKGLDWGKDFDHGSSAPELDDYLRRTRRLESNYDWKPMPYYNDGTLDSLLRRPYEGIKTAQGEGSTQNLDDKQHEYNNHETGNHEVENHKTQHQHAGNKHEGFKTFADAFAKKFGSEDHKKDSTYLIKRNQDKGEKKKGFRRVYHKNEYQEEDEFYDNNNSSAKAEEKGSSNTQIGGIEESAQGHAVGEIKNESSAFNKDRNTDKNIFKNNHQRYGSVKGLDKQFNKYRDVAKKAAQSNNADYHDNFRS
ncbi:uncharacterized protein LOC115440518 [Manduca sexta]|uniref:uncharacterized protein LOC115440518 n=1 Tax=Manduca sexta TaxID=7130 RepID=UPI001182C588|nr:uncharacterized protein LOC115440518 [Manduca sexta]